LEFRKRKKKGKEGESIHEKEKDIIGACKEFGK